MFNLYYTALKKFSGERNQPLYANLGADTRAASYYDFAIFYYFRKNDW